MERSRKHCLDQKFVRINGSVMNYIIISIITLLLLANTIFAQSYKVDFFTEADGIPGSSVFDGKQDSKGNMWFSVRSGLASYDGQSWQHFINRQLIDENSFIFIDKYDTIWIIASDLSIVTFDGENWTNYHHENRFSSRSIPYITAALLETDSGPTFFICSSQKSLFFKDKSWEIVSENNSPNDFGCNYVIVSQNRFLVSTNDGLREFDDGKWIDSPLASLDYPPGKILALTLEKTNIGRNQKLWILGKNWYGYLKSEKTIESFQILAPNFEYEKNGRFNITDDGAGGLIFGQAEYIYRLHPEYQHIQALDISTGIRDRSAYSLFLDKEKNVWIMGYRGVSKIAGFRFENFSKNQGLYADEVSTLLEINSSKIVLGHPYGISIIENGHISTLSIPQELLSEQVREFRIMDMVKDDSNELWLACSHGGLIKIDKEYNFASYGIPNGITNINAVSILDDKNILIGTNNGFFSFDIKTSKFRRVHSDFENHFIRSITAGRNGKLLIATGNSGIIIYDTINEEMKSYKSETSFGNSVFSVSYNHSGDEILVGTNSGLYKLSDGKLIPHEFADSKIERPVYLIFYDEKSTWIGSDDGVYRWDGNDLKHYQPFDGFVGMETNRNAGIADLKGNIWIGTSRGVSHYYYDEDPPKSIPNQPELLSVEAGGVDYTGESKIVVSEARSSFSFKCRMISLRDEKHIIYDFILRKIDGNIARRNMSNSSSTQFFNLESGKYRLEVKARHHDGPWSFPTISGQIVVQKPIHKQWWFMALFVIPFAALLYFIIVNLRHQTEKEILVSEVEDERQRLLAIASNTDSILLQLDKSGIIKYVSPGTKKVLGYHKSLLLGTKYIRWVYKEDRSTALEIFNSEIIVRKEKLQIRLIHKDSSIRWFSASTRIVIEDHQIVGMNVVAHDITHYKILEEQLNHSRKMQAVGMLAGGIAHDFNNLLTAITGHIDLAKLNIGEDNPIGIHLDEIDKAATRASGLTGQLLAFSRKQKLNPQLLNLNKVVLDLEGMIVRLLRENIGYSVDLEKDLWPIKADLGQLEQVITNLAINARDAMQSGGTLKVKTYNSTTSIKNPGSEDRVFISIIDNGTGMSKEVSDRVFEPFFTTKKLGKGTGLGLASVYGVIKQSGGNISIDSEIGVGTTFTLEFSRAYGEFLIPEKSLDLNEAKGGSERILVVEDEEALRNLTVKVLKMQGYEIYEASNGREALEVLRKEHVKFDLLLSDIIMPIMDGPELAKQSKKIYPRIKLLFMSGYPANYINQQGIEMDDAPILHKPFRTNELVRMVRETLDS
jgi:PAS domain S-box-containing protein